MLSRRTPQARALPRSRSQFIYNCLHVFLIFPCNLILVMIPAILILRGVQQGVSTGYFVQSVVCYLCAHFTAFHFAVVSWDSTKYSDTIRPIVGYKCWTRKLWQTKQLSDMEGIFKMFIDYRKVAIKCALVEWHDLISRFGDVDRATKTVSCAPLQEVPVYLYHSACIVFSDKDTFRLNGKANRHKVWIRGIRGKLSITKGIRSNFTFSAPFPWEKRTIFPWWGGA